MSVRLFLFCSSIIASTCFVAAEGLRLSLLPRDQHGWIRVQGGDTTNQLVTLSASSNLLDWQVIAVMHANRFEFADPSTGSLNQRFYKVEAAPINATNDWKNQLAHPFETFNSSGDQTPRWVKFAISLDDPVRVFYADSHRFTFHYDFVTARLEPFIGITPAEFDHISQLNTNRELVLGTVLNPGLRTEYGIQFVSRETLPREMVRELFELVKSTIVIPPDTADGPVQAFYIPAFEQLAVARENSAYFASNGIPISSAERWLSGNVCYSKGWGLGTLKFFEATNVPAAYAAGRLRPQDILITDGIPAELPYVSGIISLTPTTPNSHVAILAQSYGVPFAYLIDESERARVLQLTNREVAFQTGEIFLTGDCQVLIHPLDAPLESAAQTDLLALKQGPAFQFTPRDIYGFYTASTEDLLPSDIKFFGGKAANYGLLRRIIPSNSQPAIAISFDLWNDFMAQTLANGQTLQQEISNRLAGFSYPPNVGAVQTQLAGIRTLIRSSGFTTNQQHAVTNALSVFDRKRNIRFRSSTNVEDAESFSGAGLYGSFSGCLADDQDDDLDGPSACDSTEEDERGVFRAILRVFASFYNDNAFLERLRLGVNENQAGMALLVHHSTPDEFEMANGVATGQWSPQSHGQPPRLQGQLVTQLGAVSVANPDGSAIPEQVSFGKSSERATSFNLNQGSSLVRLGDYVMNWDADYTNLVNLLFSVADAYVETVTNRPRFHLDIEYKKVIPGLLELKQIREIPTVTNRYIAPFILHSPGVTFANWHGFYDDIFMAHRLKSRWTLTHRNVQFTPTNLAAGFYTHLSIEYLNGTNVQTISGPLISFSNYVHAAFSNAWDSLGWIEDRWTMETISGPMDFTLRTSFDREVDAQGPFRLFPESRFNGIELDVHLSQPVLEIESFGQISYPTNTSTRLYALRAETDADLFRETAFEAVGQSTNVSIRSSYWLPAEARGDDCRCPVLRIVESRIEGLTTEPLVLRGYWSQTFKDIHTSGYRQFIFEPRLEPGLSSVQLSELAAANIMQIYVNGNGDFTPDVLLIVGFDGSLRRFSDQNFGP